MVMEDKTYRTNFEVVNYLQLKGLSISFIFIFTFVNYVIS